MTDRPEALAGVDGVDRSGRTALVTGSTSGVGRETALALARLGADVVVHRRDRAAGERVVRAAERAGGEATFHRAEFADPDAVDALARRVRADVDPLDLVVHAAGAHFPEGTLVDAGAARVERTFAVNHLAPFRLTTRLRDRLAPDVRVVVVASRLHSRADGAFDVRSVDGYDGLAAYARSKLANVLFARGLADRLDGSVATACHPGFVPDSGLWRNASLPVSLGVRALSRLPRRLVPFVDTAAEAAATPTYLAAAPRPPDSGAYVVDCERAEPAPAATRPGAADDLWAHSEDLTGLTWA
ncbi:SDR family NAD(P)-dependent oxidoreductase [Candidatus Halobonum tyrrellensis]|uniref:Oxidoreductase n=1 Tax=Candidatus Halobonum tyrrellensis G22 TaxID=1324957 RepID=V4GRH5_9EURY|nr:SDR family NAD(P)-dependent oxidoreductase [Candidatus Halobonum tyrrellensis]ESP87661.1 oxidoreductase [Candidatus Halobonum tyrrellensis G22]